MIEKAIEAEILRLYHVEKWKYCTIARVLKVHHGVVRRVIDRARMGAPVRASPAPLVTPYVPFILETITRYPDLTSRRIYDMIRERGYPGQPDHFRRVMAKLRPRPVRAAFLRLATLIGEQAQVDWAHFGKIQFNGVERKLSAFVMVLAWSRQVFVRFYLNERLGSFLAGHKAAFEFFSGVPRVLLYDNLKSAVLERQEKAIRFHPTFLEFAAHYRYEPRPVGVRKAWEKGKVERTIRYIRESFFAGREWRSVEKLNEQAMEWSLGLSGARKCPEDLTLTVSQAFAKEKEKLLPLPANPFPTYEQKEVVVGKWPYIRFDLNEYSVPHTLCGKTLMVLADEHTVQIHDGAKEVANHLRYYDRGMMVEQKAHVDELWREKRAAGKHRAISLLRRAVPESEKLLEVMAERGQPLPSRIAAMTELLECFGVAELSAAVTEVLLKNTPHISALRQVLDRRLHERESFPLVPVPLSEKARAITIRPHQLSLYDLQSEVKKDE